MKLQCSDDAQGHAAAVRLVLGQCGDRSKVACATGGKGLSLEQDGTTITGVNAICRAIAGDCLPAILGDTPEAAAQVDQWLNFIHTRFTPVSDDGLAELNDWLASRSFLCGHKMTLADLCVYAALSPEMVTLPIAQQSVFCHVLRWYDHIHHAYDAPATKSKAPVCPAVRLPLPTAPKPPVATSAAAGGGGTAAAPAASGAASAGKAAASASGSGATGGAAAQAQGGQKKGGDKAGGKGAKGGDAAAAKGGDGGAGGGGKEEGKGKKGGGEGAEGDAAKKKAERAAKNAAKNAPAAPTPATPDALSILVGTITSIKKHPDAEKLYMEEIDVGEDAPRQVVSGLVDWVPEADMMGRRVAVLCNLKPAKMRGVTSYGMVLCASTEGAVEPLAVPEGVANGERVMVAGFDGAAEPQLPPKKKIWEALMPDLATTAEGVAGYKGIPLSTSKGPLTSKIGGAPVK